MKYRGSQEKGTVGLTWVWKRNCRLGFFFLRGRVVCSGRWSLGEGLAGRGAEVREHLSGGNLRRPAVNRIIGASTSDTGGGHYAMKGRPRETKSLRRVNQRRLIYRNFQRLHKAKEGAKGTARKGQKYNGSFRGPELLDGLFTLRQSCG